MTLVHVYFFIHGKDPNFNIYNRWKNLENSRPYWPSDSLCAYVDTLEQLCLNLNQLSTNLNDAHLLLEILEC